MNKVEAQQANTIHAIWDMLIMKHSVESILDTYHIGVADLEMVAVRIREKCDDYRAGAESQSA